MIGQLRIVGKYAVSRSGSRGKQSGIAAEISKAEAHTAALAHIAGALAKKVARTAHGKVLFGYFKAVVGFCQYAETPPCIFGLAVRNENAVRFTASASYAPAQLMQL